MLRRNSKEAMRIATNRRWKNIPMVIVSGWTHLPKTTSHTKGSGLRKGYLVNMNIWAILGGIKPHH